MSRHSPLFLSTADPGGCLLLHAQTREDEINGFLPDAANPPPHRDAITLEELQDNQRLVDVAALLCKSSLHHYSTNGTLFDFCLVTQSHPDILHEAHLLLSLTTSTRLSPEAHAIVNCNALTERQSLMAASAFLSQIHRRDTHPDLAMHAYQFFGMEMFGAVLDSYNTIVASQEAMVSEAAELGQLWKRIEAAYTKHEALLKCYKALRGLLDAAIAAHASANAEEYQEEIPAPTEGFTEGQEGPLDPADPADSLLREALQEEIPAPMEGFTRFETIALDMLQDDFCQGLFASARSLGGSALYSRQPPFLRNKVHLLPAQQRQADPCPSNEIHFLLRPMSDFQLAPSINAMLTCNEALTDSGKRLAAAAYLVQLHRPGDQPSALAIQAYQMFCMDLVMVMKRLQANRAEQLAIMSGHRDDRQHMEEFLEYVEMYEELCEQLELIPHKDSTGEVNPVWYDQNVKLYAQMMRVVRMLQIMVDHDQQLGVNLDNLSNSDV